MSDSKIAELCQRIYRKHRPALKLIFENQLEQGELREFLEKLVEAKPGLVMDHSTKSIVRFFVKELDSDRLKVSKGWTRSKRILIFEFWINDGDLDFGLTMGPGPDKIRKAILTMAREKHPPFTLDVESLKKYQTIFYKAFLTEDHYARMNWEARKKEIEKRWDRFVGLDLPAIVRAIKAEKWLKKS